MEVAPSSSHRPARSWAATASPMRASSRSRSANTATRAALSVGMSSSSMAFPSCSNIPWIVHLFAYPNQGKVPAQRPFSGRRQHRREPRRVTVEPGSRAAAGRRSEPLTPAHPNPSTNQNPHRPRPRRGLTAMVPPPPTGLPNHRHPPKAGALACHGRSRRPSPAMAEGQRPSSSCARSFSRNRGRLGSKRWHQPRRARRTATSGRSGTLGDRTRRAGRRRRHTRTRG
jgi:hypothetical protein